MFSALRKLPSVSRSNAVQTRNMYKAYAYIGPPREQMSIVESWCHGLAIAAGILAVPAWILYHITEYRGIPKLGDTLKNKKCKFS